MTRQQGDLVFFESQSMTGLFHEMTQWQSTHETRLRSFDIERDGDRFCCIALVGPMAAALRSRDGTENAMIHNGRLLVAMG